MSLPYEPGRPAFASLRRTAEDLQRLAGARIEELPSRSASHPALAHLERVLFGDGPHAVAVVEGGQFLLTPQLTVNRSIITHGRKIRQQAFRASWPKS